NFPTNAWVVLAGDFNTGKATLGAGPYKFVEWVPGDRIVLERNENYYGKKPYAQKATYRFISNDSARIAALLSGDVDLIDTVPPTDIASLGADSRVTLVPVQGTTIIYIHMDSDRAVTPFATDKGGKVLPSNPFKDKRVRQALSLLMDRKLLVDRVLQGSGTPAIQMIPPGYLGFVDALNPPAADVAKAKKLLAEAGYPNGFSLTLHSASDRYSFQPEVVQAVAQFLARGGIEVKVETMPTTVFLPKATELAYSFFLLGYGNSTGEGTTVMSAVLSTFSKEKNTGSNNRGRYSNPAFDALVEKAMQELDDDKRDEILQKAAKVAVDDAAVIPLYIETMVFATKKSLVFKPGVGIPRPNPMDLFPAAK
ncbi:MAG: ABC transporter substrate-binding protein, partial [Spirochaetota bacterium]